MKRYPIDEEGNAKVSRAEINRQIERIETTIDQEENPDVVNEMRARWNYLMSL